MSTTFTRGPVADIFSSYLVAVSLSAASELGILDGLREQGSYSFDAAEAGGLDRTVVRQLLATLSWAEIVEVADDKAVVGPRFDEAYAARGYFYWMVRGCGELFSVAPGVARTDDRVGDFYTRDMRAVAVGSRLIGDTHVEPHFTKLLAELDYKVICDLGCGSGQRVMAAATARPGVRGVGVDIAPAAVELAAESVAEAGLADRISIVTGDVRNLAPRELFADVDLITCVFLGHDFWPKATCVAGLRQLRAAFPAARRLLLCDVVRSERVPGPETQIFTLGFELIHALMGVYIPTRQEWYEAFAESGWEIVGESHFAAPPGGVLFELRPADGQE
ncbi:methyltransferase domain-containing protein [Acrocarpospora catenulata]|uniref:methyltransferase domain-containing protein n=1 Tax=Acrocarpospora catenulata TaxID=2836182 RepID=UPI001BDB372C|nr:methyltransferase domain-containing protein [Acrocarpospora catenulata]